MWRKKKQNCLKQDQLSLTKAFRTETCADNTTKLKRRKRWISLTKSNKHCNKNRLRKHKRSRICIKNGCSKGNKLSPSKTSNKKPRKKKSKMTRIYVANWSKSLTQRWTDAIKATESGRSVSRNTKPSIMKK